jgi:hypothetical protein
MIFIMTLAQRGVHFLHTAVIAIFPVLIPAIGSSHFLLFSQTETSPYAYFPEDSEFQELGKAATEEAFENPARLSKIDGGPLFTAAGFEKYVRRLYALRDGGTLSVEIATFMDSHASYSMVTLLRTSDIRKGPPGSAFAETVHGILFSHGKELVRIRSASMSENLIMRIAGSISMRMGPDIPERPSLISHIPNPGFADSSLRYFPGLKSYEAYSGSAAAAKLAAGTDVEIAQARYIVENQTAVLHLLGFPTPEAAEDYFDLLPALRSIQAGGEKVYSKRVGPLVAILDGTLDPPSADRVLNPISYSYSISWIYEKGSQTRTVWGIPTYILGTVVQSLYFVALLGLGSIAAGAVFALVRFIFLRLLFRNSPKRQEPIDVLRLRLR